MVLKREPLGSLREEFLIPGRKFAPGKNWGGKAVEKNLSFSFSSYKFIQHIKNCTVRLVYMGMSAVHKLLHHRLSQCFQSTAWLH